MPIHSCTLASGAPGFKWGHSGKCYPSRKEAEAQARAIYASGYAGKLLVEGLLRKGDVPGHEFHGNQWTDAAAEADSADTWYHGTSVGGKALSATTTHLTPGTSGAVWLTRDKERALNYARSTSDTHGGVPVVAVVAGKDAPQDPTNYGDDRLRATLAQVPIKELRYVTAKKLTKDYAAPATATSGLAGYSLEGQKPGVRVWGGVRQILLEALNLQLYLAGSVPRDYITKGDVPGHEFHGNQWTGGEAVRLDEHGKPAASGGYVNNPIQQAKGREIREALGNAYSSVNQAYGRQEELDPKELRTQQKTVSIDKVNEYLKNSNQQAAIAAGRTGNEVLAVRRNGQTALIDGNHRAVAASLKNEKIKVLVVDMDAAFKDAKALQKPGQGLGSALLEAASKKKLGKTTVDQLAHEAAPSPFNLKDHPTVGQASAGNYPKGHLRIGGLHFTIENPAGSRRRPEWPPMTHHYGYIKRTEGADGDHVDAFIRVGTPENWDGPAHVVNQHVDGSFDEHKCMVGWHAADDARTAYLENYERGWDGLHSLVTLPWNEFKQWARNGDTKHHLQPGGVRKMLLSRLAAGNFHQEVSP